MCNLHADDTVLICSGNSMEDAIGNSRILVEYRKLV